jgi:hypothetical protein
MSFLELVLKSGFIRSAAVVLAVAWIPPLSYVGYRYLTGATGGGANIGLGLFIFSFSSIAGVLALIGLVISIRKHFQCNPE